MNLKFLAIAAFGLAVSTSASAGDVTRDWSGMYVGVNAGINLLTDRWVRIPDAGGSNVVGTAKDNALTGGIYLGYNQQVGSYLLGAEMDLGTSFGDWRFQGKRTLSPAGIYTSTAESNLDGSLRARIGMPIDNMLLYGTAGLVFASVTHDYNDTAWKGVPAWENSKSKFTDLMIGYTVGTGIEYALTETLSTRIEYRFTDLGQTTNYNSAWSEKDRQDLSSHAVKFGISLKF